MQGKKKTTKGKRLLRQELQAQISMEAHGEEEHTQTRNGMTCKNVQLQVVVFTCSPQTSSEQEVINLKFRALKDHRHNQHDRAAEAVHIEVTEKSLNPPSITSLPPIKKFN